MLATIDLRLEPDRLDEAVSRPAAVLADARAAALRIIAEVREGGDTALCELTRRYDHADVPPGALRVPGEDLASAWEEAGADVQDALRAAGERIRRWNDVPVPDHRWSEDGLEVVERTVAVRRAGVYVPGGRAAYPSTVLMTVIPAQCAGVPEIALCVPPGSDGRLPVPTAAAAHMLGLDEVYRVGGAQAIAALAFGTETIPPVDVVVGPGNAFVAMAKREVAGVVGVESLAGPSECVVIADETADPVIVAVDLLTQAEHGPGGFTVLVTWVDDLATRVVAAVERLVAESDRAAEIRATLADGGRIVLCADAAAAIEVANRAAPEHLQLVVAEPEPLLVDVRNAGAVFVGVDTPVALGDYVAGPSHVLPTGGTARFASALRPADFRKSVHVVTASRRALETVGRVAVTLAAAEGLSMHARSVAVRLGDDDEGKGT
ncbi:MAG: histidinol dehydrogenase [Acidimicrobiia bacterium]|nr:histidinol dehydrogenase [Acidimicrobiia bacterium]